MGTAPVGEAARLRAENAALRARIAELEQALEENMVLGSPGNPSRRQALRNQAVVILAEMALELEPSLARKSLAKQIATTLRRYELTMWARMDRERSPAMNTVTSKRYAQFQVVKFNGGAGLEYRTIMKILDNCDGVSNIGGAKNVRRLHHGAG